MSAECFMIEPTLRWRECLRRFQFSQRGGHFHDTHVVIGEVTRRSARAKPPVSGENLHDPDDPRWPTRCACGTRFGARSTKQLSYDRLWVDARTGEMYPMHEAPVGALLDATWLPDAWRGHDGLALMLRLPHDQWWTIDGPATNGGGWDRTGDPPRITVRPSIAAGEPGTPRYYHGWVTDGIVSDHIG